MANKLITLEKDTGDILRFLGEASIFKDLPPESLGKISERIQIETFAKDHTIIKKGAPGVQSTGAIKIWKYTGFE